MSCTSSNTTETKTNSAADHLVGCSGMAQFGKKNKWYPCVVKKDNKDGTIKVKWEEDKTVTSRLPVEKFSLNATGPDEEPVDVEIPDIFDRNDGDY